MDPFTLFIRVFIAVALSFAANLLNRATDQEQQKTKTQKTTSPIQTTITVGGDMSMSYIMGFTGTAGHLEYGGVWGKAGKTPNAYQTRVISVSDLPVNALVGLHVNSERCTIMTGETEQPQGYPVEEYRVNGTDYLWVKFYDGTQTAADSFLLDKFGGDAERPWESDMVGRGVAYVIVTARYNTKLHSGFPECVFEIEGIPLYDPRQDTTAGGSGSQQDDDSSTWVYNDNPICGVITLMKGLSFGGDWVHGLQRPVPNLRLPYADLETALDKCDSLITLADDSTEKQYRFGIEVKVEEEPLDIIEEILKGCAGRMSENGGIYRFVLGDPGSSVYAFTDEDLVIDTGYTFNPFPKLKEVKNYMTATYPEQDENWNMKEAPPRQNSAWEAEDQNRRLTADVTYRAVPWKYQVQRLMQMYITEARRFRQHAITLPPETFVLEPLDVISWTSEENGYDSKQWLILAIDCLPDSTQVLMIQEIDSSDYSWDSETDQLPVSLGFIGTIRPAAQEVTGWQVDPATMFDDDGTGRRPTILVSYDDDLDDVQFVKVTVRLKSSGDVIYDVTTPYTMGKGSLKLNGTFLPNTLYQVQGQLIPFTADRDTIVSAWLDVTTDDIRLTSKDIDNAILGASAYASSAIRSLTEEIHRLATSIVEQDYSNFDDKATVVRQVSAQVGELSAQVTEIIDVTVSDVQALASEVLLLNAAMGGAGESYVNVLYQALAAPSGFSARYGLVAGADDGTPREASFIIDVPAVATDPTRILLKAGQTIIVDDSDNLLAMFDGSELNTALIPNLTANKVTTGILQSVDGNSFIDLDNNIIHFGEEV